MTNHPLLSVLIPFYGDNPSALVETLIAQRKTVDFEVEILLGNDASPDGVPAPLSEHIGAHTPYLRLLNAHENMGRARIRNHLAEAASGDYLLFLDADMALDDEDFLHRCGELCRSQVEIAFGGISLLQTPRREATTLHRALSEKTECLNAAERNLAPALHLFTSNLLVKRDVFLQCRFDGGFSGWGWEDIEWALRASMRFRIHHIDNPASHLGLYEDSALLNRYEDSLENFRRVMHLHPQAATHLRLSRLAQKLARLPFSVTFLRQPLRSLALRRSLPLSLRLLAFRLWRACLYAEAFETDVSPSSSILSSQEELMK